MFGFRWGCCHHWNEDLGVGRLLFFRRLYVAWVASIQPFWHSYDLLLWVHLRGLRRFHWWFCFVILVRFIWLHQTVHTFHFGVDKQWSLVILNNAWLSQYYLRVASVQGTLQCRNRVYRVFLNIVVVIIISALRSPYLLHAFHLAERVAIQVLIDWVFKHRGISQRSLFIKPHRFFLKLD